jgi:hypothetical protein
MRDFFDLVKDMGSKTLKSFGDLWVVIVNDYFNSFEICLKEFLAFLQGFLSLFFDLMKNLIVSFFTMSAQFLQSVVSGISSLCLNGLKDLFDFSMDSLSIFKDLLIFFENIINKLIDLLVYCFQFPLNTMSSFTQLLITDGNIDFLAILTNISNFSSKFLDDLSNSFTLVGNNFIDKISNCFSLVIQFFSNFFHQDMPAELNSLSSIVNQIVEGAKTILGKFFDMIQKVFFQWFDTMKAIVDDYFKYRLEEIQLENKRYNIGKLK